MGTGRTPFPSVSLSVLSVLFLYQLGDRQSPSSAVTVVMRWAAFADDLGHDPFSHDVRGPRWGSLRLTHQVFGRGPDARSAPGEVSARATFVPLTQVCQV